ncbi:c-type cytochrome [Paracoccus sp. (in: a-proteobacteria)]|uniref:c-type cytochrome n=1 Tax=Paracoccus sp. TaxID=267 RepID=UPI003A88151B
MRARLLSGLMLLSSMASGVMADPARRDYILHCSGCHGMTGKGTIAGGIPPFPDSVGKIAGSDIGRTYIVHVPGVNSAGLSAGEIADVLNYILDQWGEGGDPRFSGHEVAERSALPIGEVVAYRRKVVAELSAAGIEIAEYPWP